MLHHHESYLVEFGSQFHDFVETQWLSGRVLDRLVLVQPRKTRSDITEKLLTGT